MQTFLGFPTQPLDRPVFLTIGNFDGVHRGHQMLVSEMVEAAHAAGCGAGLLTFDPHPVAVLRPDLALPYLTSPEERADLLAALGLDFVLILPFDRATAALSAAEFMRQIVARVPLCALWIGPDFALGRGREGSAARLGELGRELGYDVRVTPVYDWHGEPVRSSRIRSLLANDGAVEQAAELLGRPYTVWGEVVHGAERGRGLGFPTANLKLPAGRLAPAYGIYACWAWRGETGFPAAVNVGVRPSFDNGHPSVEAYLLDFDGDLYGETLGLSFIQRLRGEQRFADIHALISQMGRDVEATRRTLADPPDDTGLPATGVEAGSWKLDCPICGRGSGAVLDRTAAYGRLGDPRDRRLAAPALCAGGCRHVRHAGRRFLAADCAGPRRQRDGRRCAGVARELAQPPPAGPGIGRRALHPVRDPRDFAGGPARGRLRLPRRAGAHGDQGGHVLRSGRA